jgi:uncharacterized damage-inducible protein DinB
MGCDFSCRKIPQPILNHFPAQRRFLLSDRTVLEVYVYRAPALQLERISREVDVDLPVVDRSQGGPVHRLLDGSVGGHTAFQRARPRARPRGAEQAIDPGLHHGRMTWKAPEVTRVGGSFVAPEPEMLRGLLDWHRSTLLFKCAGLSGEQLAHSPIAGSNLSLLGLVRHLAKVERVWFRRRFRGEQIDNLYSTLDRPDADFEDVNPAHAEADHAQLLAEQATARQAVAGASLDATFIHADGDEVSLRFVFNHMIGEYARHNGHADLLRQYVDGVTGA